MRVHVLTEGFGSPNGRAFLFPLVCWSDALREVGMEIRFFFKETAELTDADILIIDSKFHRLQWAEFEKELLGRYAGWKETCSVVFYDNSDSAGWLLHQVLPVVDGYFKNQLLRDTSMYSMPLYGRRFHSDYYYRKYGIEDEIPELAEPVTDPGLLDKLRIGWNSGLANYSLTGPLRMATYSYMPLRVLLRFPKPVMQASSQRTNEFSCRFGTDYSQRGVAWQREMIREKFGSGIRTDKISRIQYFRELCNSKVVMSPFGLGEITLKDFEVFLTGGLLLKPDMSHLNTWPDFYQDNETCIQHSLDLDDMKQKLKEYLTHDSERVEIAAGGQSFYLEHTIGPHAEERFAEHLSGLLHPYLQPS